MVAFRGGSQGTLTTKASRARARVAHCRQRRKTGLHIVPVTACPGSHRAAAAAGDALSAVVSATPHSAPTDVFANENHRSLWIAARLTASMEGALVKRRQSAEKAEHNRRFTLKSNSERRSHRDGDASTDNTIGSQHARDTS